jgi:hypothetical protein
MYRYCSQATRSMRPPYAPEIVVNVSRAPISLQLALQLQLAPQITPLGRLTSVL